MLELDQVQFSSTAEIPNLSDLLATKGFVGVKARDESLIEGVYEREFGEDFKIVCQLDRFEERSIVRMFVLRKKQGVITRKRLNEVLDLLGVKNE